MDNINEKKYIYIYPVLKQLYYFGKCDKFYWVQSTSSEGWRGLSHLSIS